MYSTLEIHDLLDEVCVALQLSDTEYGEATDRYTAVSKWLGALGSPLASFFPRIYPQGSARLRTTVSPRGRVEHDVDLVCLLNVDVHAHSDPLVLYAMVEERLRNNGQYKNKLERFKRCIRINYANEFHLDITPAIPDRSRGGSAILVPDRDIKEWKPSDPIAYANWFDGRAKEVEERLIRKYAEALPAQEEAMEKAPLRRAVQLLKRHRDMVFDGSDDSPRSIVLTTLAAQHYAGHEETGDALIGSMQGMIHQIQMTGALHMKVPNPIHPQEDFSEAWVAHPEHYRAFVSFLRSFSDRMQRLARTTGGIPSVAKELNELFGEEVTTRAVAAFADRVERTRQRGSLRAVPSLVRLSAAAAAAPAIPRNTFYGL